MSVSILPEVRLREERLKATRRRGIRHVAHPPSFSSKCDEDWGVVRRSKSEQKLPDGNEPLEGDVRITASERRDRIKSIISAVESQKSSVIFSGHRSDKRPGSGASSLGSRSISFHSLCAQNQVVPPPVPKINIVKAKPKPKSQRSRPLNLKAPVLNFQAPVAKTIRKSLPPAKKTSDTTHSKALIGREVVDDVSTAPPNGDQVLNGRGVVPIAKDPRKPAKLNPPIVMRPPVRKAVPRHPIPIPAEHKPGVVPKYLKKRQAQWEKEEKEEKMRQELLLQAPPGYSVMSDDERKDTLTSLKQKEEDLVRELVSLPVRIDTMRIQRRKLEIENQLTKIDEGIRMFSRPKVYVRHQELVK